MLEDLVDQTLTEGALPKKKKKKKKKIFRD